MNKIIKYITIVTLFVFSACTENFEEINTNPYQISDASLRQDNNHVGAFFPTMLGNIFGDQIEHNLCHDSWARHLATPTPFVGGINNTTYYIRWNVYWNRCYNQVFSLSGRVIEIAEAEGNDVFVAWAKLIRILSASRLSAYHGPIIYTNYGSLENTILYDSEETLYNTWFSELDDIVATFEANSDFGGMAAFDASYGGDIPSWIKFANSMRLQLAMRISKVAPALAKAEGEKAIATGKLITTAGDDFKIRLYNGFFPPARIAWGWGDTRMSASMESILVGYEDGRLSQYFEPVAAANVSTLTPDHPDLPYKGIRNGATLGAKDDRIPYSNISSDFNPTTADGMRRCFMSSETHFLLAEAALRGWTGAGSAEAHYRQGVMDSFAEWGAAGAADYLEDDTSIPIDYNDPKATGNINDFRRGETDPRLMNRWDVTVKWDEAASNEVKLEKIITQKWIAAYMNTIEAWVDHRRTGYPKLPYNYQNDSNEDWGVVAADDFLRRMPFVDAERNNNAAGVADATTKLGGPDEIGTRLWWDTGGPNF